MAKALAVCGIQGHLAMATPPEENDFLLSLVPGTTIGDDGPWLGGSQSASETKTSGEQLDQWVDSVVNVQDADVSGGPDIWQSFTAGRSGSLSKLRVPVMSNYAPFATLTAPGTIEIYEGQGISGTKLTEENVIFGPLTITNTKFQNFTFSNPATITAGLVYTFRMISDEAADNPACACDLFNPGCCVYLLVDVNDPYPDGRSSVNVSWDFFFETYVAPQNIFAGGWSWVTSESFQTYTDWAENQPNSADEDCLHFFIDSGITGSWNDKSCGIALPYLVEIDGSFTDSDGNGIVDCLDEPASEPSNMPSMFPTQFPSDFPSGEPSSEPSTVPSEMPWTTITYDDFESGIGSF